MKKQLIRLISCLLVLIMVLSKLPIVPVPIFASTDKAAQDAQADHFTPGLSASAGDWGTAIFVDGLRWYYFHNEVQKEARVKYRDLKRKELSLNLLNGKTGRADLWRLVLEEDENGVEREITYIWEVKPASFSVDPKLTRGLEQLQGYVDAVNAVEGQIGRVGNSYIERGEFERRISPTVKYILNQKWT